MDHFYSPWKSINWIKYLGDPKNKKSPFYQLQNNLIQFVFLINQNTKINLHSNIYEISGSKIKELSYIGPYICNKKNIFSINPWENLIEHYYKNPSYKWWGIRINILPDKYNVNLLKDIISKPNFAVIIPYRNRSQNLENCLPKLKKYYSSQKIDYDIWIVEQNKFGNWNKGTTFNIGFIELKDSYTYFILNDLDTIPEKNLPFLNNFSKKFRDILETQVLHLIGYDFCLGGMFIFNAKNFITINGFCNMFNNWGREDRELQNEFIKKNIIVNKNYLISDFYSDTHNTDYNFWKQKGNKMLQSRYYYYLNQIAEYNSSKYRNGLSNLKKGKVTFNKKIIYRFVFDKFTNGFLKINNNINFEFVLEKMDICILNNKYKIPINPLQKNPILILEIIPIDNNNCKVIINIDSIFQNIYLDHSAYIEWKYQTDLDLSYDIFYTPFKNKEINYQSEINVYPFYQISLNF